MNLDPFIYWIKEREAIRLKKEAGLPPPWTSDPILQTYRFCNARREDDRVTVWIREHIREPYADHPQLWWMLCVARQINWPDTLAELIEQEAWPTRRGFRPEHMTEVLEARRARGEKIETGAYLIRAESDRNVPWFSWSKRRYVAEIVLGRLWHERSLWPTVPATLQAKHEWLTEHRGWGPFTAFQAVIDMAFTSILADSSDRQTWFASGPGTIRGLNRLHERPVKQVLSQEQALEELRVLYPLLIKESNVSLLDWLDTGNVACESDKFLRVKNGEGRPRALYRGAV